MSTPVTTARASRRLPILVLIAVAIVAGVVAGTSKSPTASSPVEAVEATQLPAHDAVSTAWYCPGLPSAFPMKNQTFTLSNLGATPVQASVTVHPDDGSAPVTETVAVPHASVRTFERKTLPAGPLVVEPFSPDVMVSAGLESDDRLATVPCATTAAKDWYFAGGTTVRGVTQWLVLEDPFSADARVDVTLRTDAGLAGTAVIDGARRARPVARDHPDPQRGGARARGSRYRCTPSSGESSRRRPSRTAARPARRALRRRSAR